MKKVFIMPFMLVFVFTCALQAGKKDYTGATAPAEATTTAAAQAAAVAFTDRIDFTAAAGDFTQVSGAVQAASQEEAQAEDQQEKSSGNVLGSMPGGAAKKKQAKGGSGRVNKQKEAVPEVPEAMGFTFDLMSIPRSSIDPFDLDLSFSLVFGDYGNFGLEAIYYLQFLSADTYFGGTVGLDLAFDIFPLGNSPAGFYIGPVLGGRMYIMGDNIEGGFVPGANAGYRLNLGGFIMDAGFIYDAIITFDPKIKSPINDFQFQLSIGGFFEQTTPEMVKAGKKEDKQQGDKK